MLHTRLSCQLLGGADIAEVVQSICLDYMVVFCWRLGRIGLTLVRYGKSFNIATPYASIQAAAEAL